ncbi:MAG: addiction module protein [Hyphomicrobiaceae bacterium]|jgi:putative addiction module component (TIGR02574 family)
MNERVRALVEEARKLTSEERRELVDLLETELADEGTPEEIEAAWLEEVERRIAAAERGDTAFVDADEVLSRMRQLIR